MGLRLSGSRWTGPFSAVISSLTMISARPEGGKARAARTRQEATAAAARVKASFPESVMANPILPMNIIGYPGGGDNPR